VKYYCEKCGKVSDETSPHSNSGLCEECFLKSDQEGNLNFINNQEVRT